jgi:hypothetical protein
VRTTVLLAEAQFNVDHTKWLAGTGTDESWRHLEHRRHPRSHTTQRVQTATTAVTVLTDIYAINQPSRQPGSCDCHLGDAPTVIDAVYRVVASGSTSEPEIFWQGRNGPPLGEQPWSGQPYRRAHDHGSATSDLR